MTSPRSPRRRPRRRSSLGTLAVLLVGLFFTGTLYTVLAPGQSAQAAAGGPPPAAQIEEGRRLFLANCSTCHGLNSEGTTDGPSLVGVGAAAVDFQVATGRMPLAQQGPQAPRGRILFTPEQIDAMAAYVGSLGPGPAIPHIDEQALAAMTPEEIAEGGEIFRTNCAMCHNFAGVGGALTRGKYAPSLQGVEPVHIYEAMLTGPQSMPVFADTTLPEHDKLKIIRYLQALEENYEVGGATLGQLGPVTEGLVSWVVGIGSMIVAAVWLGAKSS